MSHNLTASENLKVQKRNGQVVAFNFSRISHAIANAFKEVNGLPREADLPGEAVDQVNTLSHCVLTALKKRYENKEFLNVEEIQDEVIRQLFENGFKEIGECYGDYRKRHAAKRSVYELFSITKRDGKIVSFKPDKITIAIAKAFQATHNGVL